MRLVIQRVKSASVKVVGTEKTVGKIGKGLFVLVGVKKGDKTEDAGMLAVKVSKLRVMADENDKMNLTVSDVEGEFLVVSQFTLYADTSGGNRPSFINAALPDEAQKIYKHFVESLRKSLPADGRVETGSFGDYMKIDAVLDGPVTIILEN